MIWPRTFLLVWVTIVISALAVFSAIYPQNIQLFLLGALVCLCVPAADFMVSLGLLKDIKCTAVNPRVNAVLDAKLDAEFFVELKTKPTGFLRVGIAFPDELACDEKIITHPASQIQEKQIFSFSLNAKKRGRYQIDTVYVSTSSPMKFFQRKQIAKVDCEIHIYPNLAMLRKQVGAFLLDKPGVGIHTLRQVGQGRDFEKLREYIPGDNYLDIHWKTTAKRGKPITKMYQIERTQEVYMVIDSSRLAGQTPPGYAREIVTSKFAPTMLERFIGTSLIMCNVAEKQGDLFGVLNYSNHVNKFVRARNGKQHYALCREQLYNQHTDLVSPDFSELFGFIRSKIRKRALLIFLTNLNDPLASEMFVKNISLISKQHLVLVNMIQPENIEPVFTRPEIKNSKELYTSITGDMQYNRLVEIGKQLNQVGVKFAVVDNDKFCPEIVSQYMTVKKRQLL